MQRLVLFDGLNLVRRIFEARGGQAGTEFVNACLQSLQRCLEDLTPSHGVVVWDSQESTWRHQLDANYKANRPATPADLVSEKSNLDQAFLERGIVSLEIDGFEADDVLATMALKVVDAGIEAVIVSTDKMFYPMMNAGVKIYHQFERKWIEPNLVEQKYELRIDQLVDYWALSGDNSNNIKGVPGVGKKTATELLKTFDSIQGVLDADASNKVTANAEQARLCRRLVELRTDVALGVNLKDYRIKTA